MKKLFIEYFGEFENEHFIQVTREINGLFFKRNIKEETIILIDRDCDLVYSLDDFNDDMIYLHTNLNKILSGYFGSKKQKKEHENLMKSIEKIEKLSEMINFENDINNDLIEFSCNQKQLLKF